jgi:thioredoxin-dependent peroxiredoxin
VAKTPEIGQIAPDFTLPGIELAGSGVSQSEYTLSQQRGQPLVLAFYPGDNTPVCTRQLCSYTSGLESFTGFGASVWAISPQGLASHEQFARQYGLAFPLLADEGLTVARQYGIALAGVGLRRSVFVIDASGVLRWKHVTLVGLTYPAADVISAQVAALAATR